MHTLKLNLDDEWFSTIIISDENYELFTKKYSPLTDDNIKDRCDQIDARAKFMTHLDTIFDVAGNVPKA